jgi:raffinose/stachyose/melibiose transport system substrate-binding protein
MKNLLRAAAAAAVTVLALTACGGGSSTDPSNVSPAGEVKPREISWLLSRPADGAVINIMNKLADDYAKTTRASS